MSVRRNNNVFYKFLEEADKIIDVLQQIQEKRATREDQYMLRLLYYKCNAIRREIRRIMGWNNNNRQNGTAQSKEITVDMTKKDGDKQ